MIVQWRDKGTPYTSQAMSECLKGKRIAKRGILGSNIRYQCIKSKAET
jgi:hypothetical protein